MAGAAGEAMTDPLDHREPTIRAPRDDSEREYVHSSWIEAYRYAPGMQRGSFRSYRMVETGWLEHALGRADTRVLLATAGPVILGWICYSLQPTVDVVHWVQTRYRVGRDGAVLRKRGVMRELLSAAALKRGIAYTFRGSLPRHSEPGDPVESADLWIARWLARNQTTAVYQPYKEWIR